MLTQMFMMLAKIFACHCIGDFLFQNSYIAEGKAKNWYILAVHCVLYGVPFCLCFGWCCQLYVVTALHFVIDAGKARYKKISHTTDQTLHLLIALLYLIP